MTRQPPGEEIDALSAATRGDCPRCGAHGLFNGWVGFAPQCARCGLDFAAFNIGDGPAAFLIFIVGTITVVAALVVDALFTPPWWVHLVWIPFVVGLTVGGLRLSKAVLLAQAYKHSAGEGRIVK